VAKKGEIAKIVSKAQYDYFLKQCNAYRGKGTPLDSRGQAHNAGRDDEGNIVSAGGGKPDGPPSGEEACQALDAFHQTGGTRASLPDKSDTVDADKARAEHAQMRKDRVVHPATRPRGSSTLAQRALRNAGHTPRKGRYSRDSAGGLLYQPPNVESKYMSKTIDEDFDKAINEALGL